MANGDEATVDISKPAGQQDIAGNQQDQEETPDQPVDTQHIDPAKVTRIENGRKYNIQGKDLGPADEEPEGSAITPATAAPKKSKIDYDALARQAGGITGPPVDQSGKIDYDKLAQQAGGESGDVTQLPQFRTAPQKTDDLLQTMIAKVGFEDNDRYGPQAHDVAMAQAKVVSDYIYNEILGKDTYIHNNLTYTPENSGTWDWIKQHVWSPISDDTYNRYLAGAESDRVEMLKETGQDDLTQGLLGTWAVSEETGNKIRQAINTMPETVTGMGLPVKGITKAISNVLFGVGRENAQYWRDHILNGNLVINQEPEVFARAAAKTLTDFYSPGSFALRGFGMAANGYAKAAQLEIAAGNMVKAAQLMKTARMLGLIQVGTNLPFGAQQGIELAENWNKMSVPERVAAVSAIASAAISTQAGAMEHGGWREVGHTVSDAAKTVHQKAVETAGGMMDSIGRRRDNILDRATTFDEALFRMAPTSDKKASKARKELRQASPDLQAILTKSQPKSLNEFSQAIRDYYVDREKVMMAQAGASEHDTRPVTDTLYSDAQSALNKFFKENKGKYGTDEEVAQAKKDLLELVLTSPGGGETGEAGPKNVKNLFQAENLRQDLGRQSSPKNLKASDAYRAGAFKLGEVLRDAVDQRYDAEGIKNVKELREKERIGIEVADRLKVAQENADRMGNGTFWNALIKKYGMASVSSLIASAVGTVVGGPVGMTIGTIASGIGVGNLTGYLLNDARYQNRRNPNVNLRRATKLASPSAQATDIEVQPGGQPPAQGGPAVGPAPAPAGGPGGPAAPPSPATQSATPPPPPPGAPGAPAVQPGVTPQPGAPGAPAAQGTAPAGSKNGHRFSNRAEVRQQVAEAAAPAAAEQMAFEYEPTPHHPSQPHPGPTVELEPPPPVHEARDVAEKTAVLAMPDPPANQKLNAELASHLGDPNLSDRTLGERIEAVKTDAEIMVRQGQDISKTNTGKMLTKIHEHEAEQQAAIEQAQKKAGDDAAQVSDQVNREYQKEQEAKDAELEQQLKDSIAAAKAAKEAREALKSGEEHLTDQGVRIPFKPGEELAPPEDPFMAMMYGRVGTPASHRAHELSHAIVMEKIGLPVYGILSHEHARTMAEGAIAETMADQSSLMNDDGSMNWDKVRGRLGDVLTGMVAGGIGEELVYGTDFDDNEGTQGDRDVMNQIFDQTGIKDEATRTRIINAAKAYAREILTPHIDRLATYSAAREEGTPNHLLFKNSTLEKFLGEVEQHGKETTDEGRLETGIGNYGREGEPGSEEGDQGGVAGVRGQVRANVKVNEKSTGNPDTDALIRNAGGIPAGVWDLHEHGKIIMFHDPLTGTTLAFKPTEKVTPQNVGKKLAESRRQFGLKPEEIKMMVKGEVPAAEEESDIERDIRVGTAPYRETPATEPKTIEQERRETKEESDRMARRVAAEKRQPIGEKLVQKWGTTNDPLEAGFVLPDGRMIPLHGEHDDMLKGVGSTSDTPRESAIEDDKIVRTRYRKSRRGDEVVFSVPSSGVSDQQVTQMKKSVAAMGRYGNVVMEVGDPIAAAVYNTTKEFARPSDIEPMLRDIFAHPDQGGKHPSFSGLALNMKASPEMKKLVDDTEWTTNPNTDYRQLKLIKDGSEIGRLEYDGHEGEDLYSRIRTSWLAPQYRNQGVAKEMYVKAIADAKKLGIPEFKSDTSVSEDARHVWESLIRDGKYNITKEYTNRFNANGQGGVEYTVHLDKPVTFDVQKAADEFNRSRGKDSIDAAPIPHNPEVAKKIADAYDAMKHNPNDPKVKASYDALAKDVRAQWDYATKEMGIKFEPWTKEGQPYANSKEMVNDVRNNGHLYFFQGGDFPAGHPTQKVDPETGFSTNDMFRAVHDLFGHAAQGFEFGPKGEENAWNVHRQMFSKEAIPALTSETRGQNSWVNFGKHLRDEAGNVAKKGEQGYIPQTQRPYAEQKAGLLPEEFHQPNKLGEIKAQSRVSKVRALANLEKAEDPDVRPIKYPFDASFSPKTTPSTILPDGRITSAVPIHQDVAEAAGFNDVTKFLKATGAVRVMYPEFNQDINSIAVELHQVPTDVQVRVIAHTLQRAANNGVGDGRLIWDLGMGNSYDSGEGSIGAFQRAVKNWAETVSPETGKTPIKAQMKGPWHEVAAQRAQDESAGAIDPRTGMSATEGIGTEIVPEERMPIDHVPTAKDFRSFHDENKSLFEKHPELQVGWDNNSQVPGGHELNIGASGPGAVEVARKLGQRAAFDIGKGEEIPTGGTGTETEFPGYPLEERLKDLKKVKGSSTQLFEKPLKVGESPSPTDVALALSKFTKKQLPGLELGKAAPEAMTARAKDILVDEARYQRAQNNAGQDWYTKDIAKHDDIMKEIRPELENPAKLSIFKMAEAILSAGHEPTDNVAQAVRAWDYYHENGEFAPVNPESGEPWGRYGIKSYGNAFDILNRLIQEKGEQGASDWLLSNHKVSELREYNTAKRGGRGGGIPGEPDDILPGVFVLGEKRGPFAQNLHGQEAAFTHDQWVNRSWNRWMGTADIDKEGKLVDQPRNTKERKIVKQTFEEAAKELGMTTSSLQAVLWYYEKALYEAHGVNKVGASTFSEGAQKVADNESSSFDFGHNEKEKVKK